MFAQPPPPPRPTSLAAAGWNVQFMILFGGLWAGTCLLMAVIFTLSDWPFWHDWALDQRGVRTEAVMGGTSLILCITAAPAIPLFLVGLLRGLRARRLYRRGIAAEARVTELVATASEENEKPVMEMRYVLETPNGPAHGSWKTVEPAEVGATIWVVYDPRNPDHNTPSIS